MTGFAPPDIDTEFADAVSRCRNGNIAKPDLRITGGRTGSLGMRHHLSNMPCVYLDEASGVDALEQPYPDDAVAVISLIVADTSAVLLDPMFNREGLMDGFEHNFGLRRAQTNLYGAV